MDMSKIVAGSQDKKSPYESLASSIGQSVLVRNAMAVLTCMHERMRASVCACMDDVYSHESCHEEYSCAYACVQAAFGYVCLHVVTNSLPIIVRVLIVSML